MGTLLLKCPLCCDEKFTSHNSLKYHILSIVDNLLCPACECRFDSIFDLAEHVGRECKDVENEPSNIIIAQNIKQEVEQSNPINDEPIPNIVFPKTELMENHGENSTLPKDFSSNSQNLVNNDETVYLCQMCNIHFNSIEEHLANYHDGEDVVLETEENVEDSIEESQFESEGEGEETFSVHEDGTSDALDYEYINGDKSNQIIEEQRCFDKDGRVYTRKVVKIDRFWDDKKGNNTTPLIEKYILENGKIRKITEEEAEEMEDKDSIIIIHQCPNCYLQFPKFDHYVKHICDPTKVKNKFKCIHCTAIFLNYQSLTAHMKSHLVKDSTGKIKRVVTLGPYTCDICNTIFPSFKSLRLHQRMHDPVKDKVPEAPVNYSITGLKDDDKDIVRHMFICSVCNNTYDKEYEEIHMKSHSEIENYDCTICNRKFYTKENLEMHAKAHNQAKKFTCSYCKKPFTTYEALQEHVTNQCQKRQYECQYCGRRFSRPHEKVKHERIHTGEKPHVCKICGKAFRVSYCLTLHLRTHSGTRPYQCNHCGKRFKSHSVYNHHLLTHSEVRAYKCPYCPKAFKTSVQLAGHKNSHIKPFTCNECNRPFASLYAVRSHMETHKRENNLKFDCWLCGATYARAFALRDHMKTQHVGENMSVDEKVLIELETAVSTNQIENEMVVENGERMDAEDDV